MGKIISLINTTPDGFCDSQYVNADGEFHEFVHGLLANTQRVAFGRGTFQLFQDVWPPILENRGAPVSQIRMAQALNDIPKTVFSSALDSTKWNNSSIVRTIDPEDINKHKNSGGRNMLTIGSPGVVASLTKFNLVDEYYFSIQPVIAGGGNVRLFDKLQLSGRRPLNLKGTTQLKSGVIILHYQATIN